MDLVSAPLRAGCFRWGRPRWPFEAPGGGTRAGAHAGVVHQHRAPGHVTSYGFELVGVTTLGRLLFMDWMSHRGAGTCCLAPLTLRASAGQCQRSWQWCRSNLGQVVYAHGSDGCREKFPYPRSGFMLSSTDCVPAKPCASTRRVPLVPCPSQVLGGLASLLHASGSKLRLHPGGCRCHLPLDRSWSASFANCWLARPPLVVGRHVSHDGAVGFIVPAQHGGAHGATGLAQTTPGAQGLDAVLLFLAAGAMKTNAPGRPGWRHWSSWGWPRLVVKMTTVWPTGADASSSTRQLKPSSANRSLDKVQVRFAVLDAVGAPLFVTIQAPRHGRFTSSSQRQAAMLSWSAKDVFHDVDDRCSCQTRLFCGCGPNKTIQAAGLAGRGLMSAVGFGDIAAAEAVVEPSAKRSQRVTGAGVQLFELDLAVLTPGPRPGCAG